MSTSIKFTDEELIKTLPGFEHFYEDVNGLTLHYVKGGSGTPLFLLPGWPQTWWAYRKVLPALAEEFTIVVVEIRGMGSSEKPLGGFDKKTMATDIFHLMNKLGFQQISICGHDIGAMVAFSFAANYPENTKKLILIDAMHPEESMYGFTILPTYGTLGDGKKANPAAPFPWWFAFHQIPELPEKLLLGRVYLEHDWFFNYMLMDDAAIDADSRATYAVSYDTTDGIRSGNSWFRAFGQDIEDNKAYVKLSMPVLGIGGSSYSWMSAVLPGKVNDLTMVKAEKSGHFPLEEEPGTTISFIKAFLNS